MLKPKCMMMSKPPTSPLEAAMQQTFGPTKWIVRCCELRKKRTGQLPTIRVRPQVRPASEH
jgi:hypothetical protein